MAPPRPRLSDRVAARRHIVRDASPEETVVLYRIGEAAGEAMKVGSRAWALLAAMDGSRDALGLVSALSQRGVSVSLADVEAFIEETSAVGIVEFEDRGSAPVPHPAPPVDVGVALRPIERMPGFSLACDGSGSCCRLYPTITFSPLDAARARAALPLVRDGGDTEENVFTPEQGAARRSLAVALVDGRCAYLEPAGGCGVHRVAGAGAKPFGCSLYPAALVDDGQAVRVGPAVECACVVRSGVERLTGEPLLDEAITIASELDPRAHVASLPQSIEIAPGRSLDRAAYVALSRALERAQPGDVVEALSGLAHALRGEGGMPSAATAVEHFIRGASPGRAELGRHLDALSKRVAPRARDTWRSGVDLARQTFVALDAALDLARSDLELFIAPAPRTAAAEAFYLEAVLFGHQLVTRSCRVPLTTSLVDRAARIVVSRALAVVAELGGLSDPAFAQPLALVEATIRAYGLASYVLDLA